MCSPLTSTAGAPFAAVRVNVRAVDLEKVESKDMMGRMRKTVSNMSPLHDRLLFTCVICHVHYVTLRHPKNGGKFRVRLLLGDKVAKTNGSRLNKLPRVTI